MITVDKVKNQIQNLIDTANEKTGNNDTDLTSAVGSLVECFGVGEDYLRYAMTCRFDNLNLFGKSDIVLNLDNATVISALCQPTVLNTTVEHITINCLNQVTNIGAMFYVPNNVGQDFTLKHITLNVDISKATLSATVFYLLRGLEIIDGTPLDFSSANNLGNTFGSCYALKEVRFTKGSIYKSVDLGKSSLLSDETIQSIIDGLADLTEQTTQTITFHADVKAKLTEEQIATITSKNWTLA